MSSLQTPAYPPALSKAELDRLLDVVEDWTVVHGLTVRPPPTILDPQSEHSRVLATSAPITLFPSLYPRQCFEEARKVQQPYNELYARVSQDETYLAEVVQE
jgi:glutathione synthase